MAAVAAGVEIAGPMPVFEAEPERIIGGLLIRRDFRRHQKLYRADLLPGMLRQVAGIVAAHETGIGFVAGRACEHPGVERVGLGLVDAVIPGMAGAGRCGDGDGGQGCNPEALHEISGTG